MKKIFRRFIYIKIKIFGSRKRREKKENPSFLPIGKKYGFIYV
ncbi:hypothetical protein AF75_00220 [Aliarcobacter butzleri L350]|uniref:Uncharacterized protein n=1 Tax=Aliarcobacter butzleri L351 TaxID=1447259 RepID=A0A837J700_9BACT|nr:hypothetical protein AF76_03970 [Aliarcobacter butzleri L351]KLE14062.1 hypothetical protein AF75_00220 [Aliarcobacter butzleri L350]